MVTYPITEWDFDGSAFLDQHFWLRNNGLWDGLLYTSLNFDMQLYSDFDQNETENFLMIFDFYYWSLPNRFYVKFIEIT